MTEWSAAHPVLPNGLTEALLAGAVLKSGFPLQQEVAKICSQFHLEEEWCFADRTTNEMRTLDVRATKRIAPLKKSQLLMSPYLTLLIECKRSDNPFVFFKAAGHLPVGNFPLLHGLPQDVLTIRDTRGTGNYLSPVALAMGALRESFVAKPPALVTTLTKCYRQGKDVVAGDSETYNQIVLPLVSAAMHHKKLLTPKPTYAYFHPEIVVPIAIVRAPMYLFDSSQSNPLSPIGWVRLQRNERGLSQEDDASMSMVHVDFVHIDSFADYLANHLLPFANRLTRNLQTYGKILVAGKSSADMSQGDPWDGLPEKLPGPRKRAAA